MLQSHRGKFLKRSVLQRISRFLCVAILLAVLDRANGEDYAARFKQLQTQKAADAQIEPLLSEWREKSPNDSEAIYQASRLKLASDPKAAVEMMLPVARKSDRDWNRYFPRFANEAVARIWSMRQPLFASSEPGAR